MLRTVLPSPTVGSGGLNESLGTTPEMIPPFVPSGADLTDPKTVEALYRQLLEMPLNTRAEIEQCWKARSELWIGVVDRYSALDMEFRRNTKDTDVKKRCDQLEMQVIPSLIEHDQLFDRRFVKAEIIPPSPYAEFLMRVMKLRADAYDPRNAALKGQELLCSREYDAVLSKGPLGADGKPMSLLALRKIIWENPDRAQGRQAFLDTFRNVFENEPDYSRIFERMLSLRHTLAANVGESSPRESVSNFLDYQDSARGVITDWSRDDLRTVHEAIATHFGPIFEEIMARKGSRNPWDIRWVNVPDSVTQKIPGPEKYFDSLMSLVHALGGEEYRGQLFRIEERGDIDFGRGGDRYVGAVCGRNIKEGRAKLFATPDGSHRSIDSGIHEFGHARHFLLGNDSDSILANAPTEVKELAAKFTALAARDNYEALYGDAAKHLRRAGLEEEVTDILWMAQLDRLDNITYGEGLSRYREVRERYTPLNEKFFPGIDWTGMENIQERFFLRSLMPSRPGYHRGYMFAALGCFDLLQQYRESRGDTLVRFEDMLRSAGRGTIKELYAKAGVRLRLTEEYVAELAGYAREMLEQAWRECRSP